jgi:nicotinamide mononucleotide transporter
MLFSLLEASAVLCALAYMVLVAREHIACWGFAFVSTALFTYVFFEAALSFSMLLNIYYMVMAGYGFWQWRQPNNQVATTSIHTRNPSFHLMLIGAGLLVSAVLIAWTMEYSFNQAMLIGVLDIVVSVFSIMATVMVAHKVYENWFYWMAINAAAVVLYSLSGLYMSAGLFVVYFVFSLYGWREWRGLIIHRA